MGKDVLVILMIAFGLFALIMFVLFYVYLKKYYNRKHIIEDYQKEIDKEDEDIIGTTGIDDNKEEAKEEDVYSMSYEDKQYEDNYHDYNDEIDAKEDVYTPSSMDEYNIDDNYDDEGFIPVKKG